MIGDPTLEDSLRAHLQSEGLACVLEPVPGAAALAAALEGDAPGLLLADLDAPGLDRAGLLADVHARQPGLPVIGIAADPCDGELTGLLGHGLTDVVPRHHLERLGVVVRRAVDEARARTELHRLEAELVAAQRMEVIARLAGGVAHDFNNILGVMLGYSDEALRKLRLDDPVRPDVQHIRSAAERAASLTRQLLLFSRRESVQAAVVDLNEIVASLDDMLRRLLYEHIRLVVDPGTAIGLVTADAGQVGQVLMNLVVNARDAMPNGGTLTISTRNVEAAGGAAATGAVPPGRVALAVSDTGTGIPDEVQARLFEPFFTTKPRGVGTGLGLATCQTIVRQWGGSIAVASEVGRGSTFTVYFPVAEARADVPRATTRRSALPGGRETVLLVEDDAAVRRLAAGVLAARGYTVIEAADGAEGLRVACERRGAPIHAVVTDIVMPGMNGILLAEWLQEIHPGLSVLYTSGYTEDALAQHGTLAPGGAFLPKPYTDTTLLQCLREALDERARGRGAALEEA